MSCPTHNISGPRCALSYVNYLHGAVTRLMPPPHPTHPHGYHRTHPWNFSGTTPGSAASHSRTPRLKGTLSVRTPPRLRHHPLPPHRQHRSPLRFRSSILRYHLFHRRPLTLSPGHSDVGRPCNPLHPTRLTRCLVPSATE